MKNFSVHYALGLMWYLTLVLNQKYLEFSVFICNVLENQARQHEVGTAIARHWRFSIYHIIAFFG